MSKYHGFFVGWHNLDFFSVLPAKFLLFHAPVLAFLNEIDNLHLFLSPLPPCLASYSRVLFSDGDCNTQLA